MVDVSETIHHPRIRLVVTDSNIRDYEFDFAATDVAQVAVHIRGMDILPAYSVALDVGGAGGVLTFETGLQVGSILTIYRSMTIARASEFNEGAPLQAASLNVELDNSILLLEQAAMQVSDGIRKPIHDDSADLILPDIGDRAGKLLGFDEAGAVRLYSEIAQSTQAAEAAAGEAEAARDQLQSALPPYGTAQLQDQAVTTAKLADDAVTMDKIHPSVPLGVPIFGGNVLTLFENLTVKSAGGNMVDVAAQAVLVRNAAGMPLRLEGLTLTADITLSGANGLDAGSAAASNWYHIWVLWNGQAAAALLSLSATAPSLPVGYTHMGYVGAVYNDAGGTFRKFLQRGAEAISDFYGNAVTAGTQTNYTPVDLSAFVPPTASAAGLRLNVNASIGYEVVTCLVAPAGTGSTSDFGVSGYCGSKAEQWGAKTAPIFCLMLDAQKIVYRVAGTNAQVDIAVSGWRF